MLALLENEDDFMTEVDEDTLRRRKRTSVYVTGVGLLPLVWWLLTLVGGALGVWWATAGDVIVTWNLLGAVGLVLAFPAGCSPVSEVRNYEATEGFA